MTPYQAVYGPVPPTIVPYPRGSSKVAAVEESLVERNALLCQLKQNLLVAKHRMEMQANRNRRDVAFKSGDMVLFKLQPYRHITLAKRYSNKLAKSNYGPFDVLKRVGKAITNFLEGAHEGQRVEQPLAICHTRVVLQKGIPARQVLVQWSGSSPEEATWEWLSEFKTAYASYYLEDKKSKLMRLHVDGELVHRAARQLGCLVLNLSFSYLGSIVGDNMARQQAWGGIVDRVKKKLSKWKMKMLSIGGRLTLVKSVLGSLPIYNFSIFKVPKCVLNVLEGIRRKFFNGHVQDSKKASWLNWNNVLMSKDRGGLGVSSLYE
nr:RNA-directed DNA polymerase, eukaryota [Tanacetum cinerariifolium]